MTKTEARVLFPGMAKVVDEYRDVFGEGVRVLWLSENGREVGKQLPPGIPASLGCIPKAQRASRSRPSGKG